MYFNLHPNTTFLFKNLLSFLLSVVSYFYRSSVRCILSENFIWSKSLFEQCCTNPPHHQSHVAGRCWCWHLPQPCSPSAPGPPHSPQQLLVRSPVWTCTLQWRLDLVVIYPTPLPPCTPQLASSALLVSAPLSSSSNSGLTAVLEPQQRLARNLLIAIASLVFSLVFACSELQIEVADTHGRFFTKSPPRWKAMEVHGSHLQVLWPRKDS